MSAHISAVIDILHDTTLSTGARVAKLHETGWFKIAEVGVDALGHDATVQLRGAATSVHCAHNRDARNALREAVAAAFDAVGDHTYARFIRNDPLPGGAAAYLGRTPDAPVRSTCPNCGHELSAEPRPR